MAVLFDSVTITTSGFLPRYVKHESVADRFLNTVSIAREDGEILISEKYGRKIIQLRGTLIGNSQADLEANIDTFTELFSRSEKNLDIDWNNSTRRYVATCASHRFDRDHFHTGKVPWMAEFVVLSGEGKDISLTTALSEQVITVTTPGTATFTMSGSKPSGVSITLAGFNWPADVEGMQFENVDTGEKITVTDTSLGFDDDERVIINTATKQVSVETSAGASSRVVDFSGVFPTFKIGINTFKVSAGDIVNQSSGESAADGTDRVLQDTLTFYGQSFRVPYTNATFRGLRLALQKVLSPGTIHVRMETDSSGEPSGTLVSDPNSQFTITAAGVSTSVGYVEVNSDVAFSLTANTPYWIVISAEGINGSNKYNLQTTTVASEQYTKGILQISGDSGAAWGELPAETVMFQIRYAGKAGSGAVKATIAHVKTYL